MSAILTPYLNFSGNAREALEFYRSALGGDLNVMTFADQGGMGLPEEQQSWVMHGQLDVGPGLVLMASDAPHGMDKEPHGFAVALAGDDEDRLKGWWEGLAEGARIDMALDKAPWGDWFGSLTDKFGTEWMVNISGQSAG